MAVTDTPTHSDAPLRLQAEVVGILSRLTCVRRIIAFGAIAQGRHDAWSDVDLWVVCEHRERTAWVAAALLRQVKPVLFYRKLTLREQPSGRYWFGDESPFNRLDVSFDTPEEYGAARTDAMARDPQWADAEVYTADAIPDPDGDEAFAGRWYPLAISDAEAECGRRLYIALEAAKFALRGRPWKWGREESATQLRAALAAHGDCCFAGGDLRAVAGACLALSDAGRGLP